MGTGGGDGQDGVSLLPTPAVAAVRASRKALIGVQDPNGNRVHWSAPGLEQALELARGELPREYQSWDEVHGRSGLLPTPAAADGERGQDYARTNREGSGGDDLVTAAIKAHNDSRWGKYAPAILQWSDITAPAPAPTEPNRNDKPRLNPRFSEWMMGWPAGWVCDLVDAGIISRNDALRIIGNGVVTLQAAAGLRRLAQIAEIAA